MSSSAKFYLFMFILTGALNSCGKKEEPFVPRKWNYTVSTFAGTGGVGSDDGLGTMATFNQPTALASDAQGTVFVADAGNSCVRKITASGLVSTLNVSGIVPRFYAPNGIAVDSQGALYISSLIEHKIYKVTSSGTASIFAGTACGSCNGLINGSANVALFNYPAGIAINGQGDIYVADSRNNCIRKITQAGMVSTVAGSGTYGYADGPAAMAEFKTPMGVAVDQSGTVYVADGGNNCIRKITPAGIVSTLAGSTTPGSVDGVGSIAKFSRPLGIALDSQGILYVTDYNNSCVRRIDSAGQVSTLAGLANMPGYSDGPGNMARFNGPYGIIASSQGQELYVADNYRVRKLSGQ